MGGKSIYILLYSIIVTVLVISGVGLVPATSVVGYQVLSIEREVCTEIMVEFPDKVENYPLCVKLVLIFSPSNKTNSITIDIPITINLGNKTIERIVKIPMEVRGEVKSIYLKGINVPDEENVIWVTPPTSPTPTPTPSPTITPTVTPVTTPVTTGHMLRPTNPGTTPVSPIIVKEYITITTTVAGEQNTGIESILWIIVVIVIVIIIVVIFMMKKEEKREEKKPVQLTPGTTGTSTTANLFTNTNNIVLDTGDVLNLNGENRKE